MFKSKLFSSKSIRSKRSGNRASTRNSLSFETLEPRCMLAGIFFDSALNNVVVVGGSGNDVGEFVQLDSTTYRASLSGVADRDFAIADVDKVVFIGQNGNDEFTNVTDLPSQLLGGAGSDTLTGGGGDDIINGGAGDDFMFGLGGEDYMIGADGADEMFGGDDDDRMFGGFGLNEMHGGDGDDFMFGGANADEMFGGNGRDQIFGLNGADILSAGDGGIVGSPGVDNADLILGHGGNDQFFGGGGLNVFYGGAGDDTMLGGDEENRMHGQAGNDNMTGGAGGDYIVGHQGTDTSFGMGGNDFIYHGTFDDVSDGGDGVDFVRFNGDYLDYRISSSGTDLIVRHVGPGEVDGEDTVSNVERFRFKDGDRDAEDPIKERVTVQPIIASNTNGSNTAEFFGTSSQEIAIKAEIDDIYYVAGVVVEWLAPNTWDNTFANIGNSDPRPQSDLGTVISTGDAAGVGSSNSLVLDMYFVEISAGFGDTSENTANGLAYVDDNGITMHTGDNLPGFSSGQDLVARVAAHEIAHNLGLSHLSDPANLMDDGRDLTASQIVEILDSPYTVVI